MRVYRGIGTFNFDAKLSTWIARIAYRTSLNHLEKKRLPLYDDLPDPTRPRLEPRSDAPDALEHPGGASQPARLRVDRRGARGGAGIRSAARVRRPGRRPLDSEVSRPGREADHRHSPRHLRRRGRDHGATISTEPSVSAVAVAKERPASNSPRSGRKPATSAGSHRSGRAAPPETSTAPEGRTTTASTIL
jgi:hypothetical protein